MERLAWSRIAHDELAQQLARTPPAASSRRISSTNSRAQLAYNMANSYNGIGTTYYGQSQFESDGSFVTTKWFVIGFFPLIPMSSARVQYLGTTGIPFFSRTSTFEVLEQLPIAWLQVLRTWIYAVSIFVLTITVLASHAPVASKLIVIAMGIALPHVLRWFAKQKAGAL